MNFTPTNTNDQLEPDNKITLVTYSELLKMDLPPRENLIDPFLPTAGLCMIYAKRGVGKTFFALELMTSLAYGVDFLIFKITRPAKVLYIDGEMPANAIQERLAKIEQRMKPNINMIEPVIITPDLQSGFMPNLATIKGQNQINKYIEGVDLVIIDNLSTLCNYGKENDAESWMPVQQWILYLRRLKISVVLIHHAGKGGNQRGTSRREDILDTVICLKHPSDHEPSNGAQFELHFEKARGMVGDEAKPILCQLTDSGWIVTALENSNYERVVELANDGLKGFEIAEELDLSKGYVSKLLKKAKALGEVK